MLLYNKVRNELYSNKVSRSHNVHTSSAILIPFLLERALLWQFRDPDNSKGHLDLHVK